MSSRSQSSNQQRSETNTTDARIGVESEFAQVVGGSSNSVTFTDQGALAAAGELAQGALDTISQTLELIGLAGERIVEFGTSQGTAALDAVQTSQNAEETNLASQALKLALPLALIAGVVVAVIYMNKRR